MNTRLRPFLFAATAATLGCLPATAAFAQLKLPDLAQVGGPSASPMPQAVVVEPRRFRVVVGLGITGGGDRLATARYYYDDDRNVRAGQLLQVHGGIDWRVAPRVTMQAVVGFHTDGVDSWNGSVYFTRYPVELLAHYGIAPGWRAGGGLRYTINPKLDGDGAARDINVGYKNSIGPVVEVEFFPTHWLGLKLRGVFERYEPEDGTGKKSGNHVGFFTSFYF